MGEPGGVGGVGRKLADHVVQAGEVDRVAGLAGRDGQCGREVGFADPDSFRALRNRRPSRTPS